jgi:hypothetical protein
LSPGGFVTGAGHGSTFEDDAGRLWHTATTQISINHPFERRLGLWRAGFDADGELFCDQRFSDWPKSVEDEIFSDPSWMLLSYKKPVVASSGEGADAVVDENCRTWWTASSEDATPTLTLDLTEPCQVNAVQINFADFDLSLPFTTEELLSHNPGGDRVFIYETNYTRWLLEGSLDGEDYFVLRDKREAKTDLPHDTVFFDGVSLRYLRLTVTELPFGQIPRISGFRAFGTSVGSKPGAVAASACRISPLDMKVSWSAEEADGACILWGHAPDKLYHAWTTYTESQKIGSLIADAPVYIRVDAFNSHGITKGEVFALDQ